MGAFDALPTDGSSMKAKDLADKLNVDEALLSRIEPPVMAKIIANRSQSTSHAMHYVHRAIRGDSSRGICSHTTLFNLPSSCNSRNDKVDIRDI